MAKHAKECKDTRFFHSDNPYADIAEAVVEQAVDDWRAALDYYRRIIKRDGFYVQNYLTHEQEVHFPPGGQSCHIAELRRWFKADDGARLWISMFSSKSDDIAESILRKLEGEYEAFIEEELPAGNKALADAILYFIQR